MSTSEQMQAARLLWRLYPRRDAFVRRREFSWSAEVVDPGQHAPPYSTQFVAEAATIAELKASLRNCSVS